MLLVGVPIETTFQGKKPTEPDGLRVEGHSMRSIALVTLLMAGWPLSMAAEEVHISGHASVVDGDTLDIGPIRIRLNGIDAPETGQTCTLADGASWDCGNAAANRLNKLIGAALLDCTALDRDVYGRIVASCRSDAVPDINKQMVVDGLAWAFARFSKAYVQEEATARDAHLGVWQGEAEAPWEYRENRWERAAAKSPRPGCPIKGNISLGSGERIYHTPWSANYDRTVVDEGKGERWFCDEAEAIAAGWRPALSR